jgi:hypothetical protein
VLDDYLERHGVKVVTFLKMDLQGQELTALRGLSRAFKRRANHVIYFEVRTEILQRYEILSEHIFHFLSGNGLRIFYCRDRDLIGRRPTSTRFSRSALNRLTLADFKSAGAVLQTDLLAIHESQISEKENYNERYSPIVPRKASGAYEINRFTVVSC